MVVGGTRLLGCLAVVRGRDTVQPGLEAAAATDPLARVEALARAVAPLPATAAAAALLGRARGLLVAAAASSPG